MKCGGYEIVCPDGFRRHPAYHNKGDADCDAEQMSESVDAKAMLARASELLAKAERSYQDGLRRKLKPRAMKRRSRDVEVFKWAMRRWAAIRDGKLTLCDPFEDPDPPSPHGQCPGGKHTVSPISFEHDVPFEDMH